MYSASNSIPEPNTNPAAHSDFADAFSYIRNVGTAINTTARNSRAVVVGTSELDKEHEL